MTESNVRFRHIKVTGGPIYRCQKWSNGLAIFGPLILHLFLQKKWSRCDLHFGKVVNFVPSLFRGFAPPGSCPPWLFLCSDPQNFARMEDSAGFYRFSQESARFCTFPVDFAGCVCLLRPPVFESSACLLFLRRVVVPRLFASSVWIRRARLFVFDDSKTGGGDCARSSRRS